MFNTHITTATSSYSIHYFSICVFILSLLFFSCMFLSALLFCLYIYIYICYPRCCWQCLYWLINYISTLLLLKKNTGYFFPLGFWAWWITEFSAGVRFPEGSSKKGIPTTLSYAKLSWFLSHLLWCCNWKNWEVYRGSASHIHTVQCLDIKHKKIVIYHKRNPTHTPTTT